MRHTSTISKKHLIILVGIFFLLSACSSKSFEKEKAIVEESTSNYLDNTSDEPIFIRESDDGENLYIHVDVKDSYSEFNRRKQWEGLEDAVVAFGVRYDKGIYEQIRITFNNNNDRFYMNVYGERKMNLTSTYEMWMTRYYDENGEPVFYPSY